MERRTKKETNLTSVYRCGRFNQWNCSKKRKKAKVPFFESIILRAKAILVQETNRHYP